MFGNSSLRPGICEGWEIDFRPATDDENRNKSRRFAISRKLLVLPEQLSSDAGIAEPRLPSAQLLQSIYVKAVI